MYLARSKFSNAFVLTEKKFSICYKHRALNFGSLVRLIMVGVGGGGGGGVKIAKILITKYAN